MSRLGLFILLALAVACTASPPTPPTRNSAYCAELFDQLDTIERTVLAPRDGSFAFPDLWQMQIARIQQARCLTLTRDLVGLEQLGEDLAPQARPAGPALRPVAVQAGVVTNMDDDARARAFFEKLGFRARSVGAPRLGRRIYVEATSPQALQQILSIAQQAGFIGPYPSRYVTF